MLVRFKKPLWMVALAMVTAPAWALNVSPTNNADTLAQAIFGPIADGIDIVGTSFTGAQDSSGVYSKLAFSPLSMISSGALLTSGRAKIAEGPNDSSSAGEMNGDAADPAETFDNYDGLGSSLDLYDVTKLRIEFDNTKDQDVKLSFLFSFGSDEYFEWVDSTFNDAFFSFLDANPVTLSRDKNNLPINVNNNFFTLDNRPDGWESTNIAGTLTKDCAGTAAGIEELQYDGFTPVLRTTFTVTPGRHSLTFVIGDAGDHIYDSGVFISGGFENGFGDDGTEIEDPVPEPSSLIAVATGIGVLQRRRRNR